MEEIKYLPIKEFRELGYLQELNRNFLHPLGLALEITQNDDGTEFISGVWDSRDDPEGIIYDLENSEVERRISFQKKLNFIWNQFHIKSEKRKESLGYIIEPINGGNI